MGPRRPPTWHRKALYFTVPGPPLAPGSPPRGPAVALQGLTAAPWGPRRPHRAPAGPHSSPGGSQKTSYFTASGASLAPRPSPRFPRTHILQCLGCLAPLGGALGPCRLPTWHRKALYFTVPGPPVAPGKPPRGPTVALQGPAAAPWGPQQAPAGPHSSPGGGRKPCILQCLEPLWPPAPPWPRNPPPRPPKAWTMPGAPAPSGVPLGAPQAARFALNDLASTAPRQTLAPRGALGTPLRPHTGQYASQGDRRSPNKQVQEQTRQSSTADLIARNAAAGTTKAKK